MKSGQIRFGISSGMRGTFAIVYDDDGVIQSGIGSYTDAKDAWKEAYEWAMAEGFPLEAEKCRRNAEKP